MGDSSFFDDPFGGGGAPDPFVAADSSLPGVALVLEARERVRAADFAAARELLTQARAGGIPAELAPHAAVLESVCLAMSGEAAAAVTLMADTWRNHPDMAALPATLGAAQYVSGEHAAAARSLFAAAVSEDPDGSLAVHRGQLTQLWRLLSA